MESSSYSLTIRFPSGTEFWLCDFLPQIGSSIERQGNTFVVTGMSSIEHVTGCEYVLEVAAKSFPDPVAVPAAAGQP